MGRRKSKPLRSGGIVEDLNARSDSNSNENLENSMVIDPVGQDNNLGRQLYIEIDKSSWTLNTHFVIAEIILKNVIFSEEVNIGLKDQHLSSSDFSLRLKLYGVDVRSFRLGQLPVLPADNIFLEYLYTKKLDVDSGSKPVVLLSGVFDGPGEGISGLVQLVNLKFITLRPVSDEDFVDTIRFRVDILQRAFDACGSLLEITRHPWRRCMMSVMSWLRPEVTTSESKYGIDRWKVEEDNLDAKMTTIYKDTGFDVSAFYESIRPSKRGEPMLEAELPDLIPQLRPYQSRATCWMVRREKAADQMMHDEIIAPFCLQVTSLEGNHRMFYNPFSGTVSLRPESSPSYFSGGILADEMGLGKTVELLACIFAHRRQSEEVMAFSYNGIENEGRQLKRQKRERVECVCGAASESYKYDNLWVQCDVCDAWQHADCVGYSLKNKSTFSYEVDKVKENENMKSGKRRRKKNRVCVVEVDGTYVCGLCSELIEISNTSILTSATLIVCPATILEQWHSEILRHTRPGSLKICIYEGARNISTSDNLKAKTTELASADVVLTTYDVLKEDLSHDSDRHEGDRRFMRFQKRYPVVPTILTRIKWWRLCLDEAQMVECNVASVTEMAMRLHAEHRWCITGTPIQKKLDDVYGLLRFLRASPFDIHRWWVEVIRDPYERRDAIAMRYTHKLFKQFMWRSSKTHVSDELQLPSQEEHVTWLTLSPVEEHFYQKQHETCMVYAHEIIERFKDHMDKIKSIDESELLDGLLSREEVAKLLVPLLKLRHACCHPQVGSSGLCSLQNSPLTMGEILEVLISKTKVEGEEALRRIVVALNGLAAIAVIEQDRKKAIELYREGLNLAEENFDNFRLDSLLSLHIHHNLAELLFSYSEYAKVCPFKGCYPSENDQEKNRKLSGSGRFDQFYVKRQKVTKESNPSLVAAGNLEQSSSHLATCDDKSVSTGLDAHGHLSKCFTDECLRKTCSNLKQKFLSQFTSKLLSAQKDFENVHLQVCNKTEECDNLSMVWWMHALDNIEEDKNSSEELLRKIDQAISNVFNSSKAFRSSRFGNISGLKYAIQYRLDSMKVSRNSLMDKLLEIDRTILNPNDADVERVRYCPNCSNSDGPLCNHCELDDLFKVYEARLFVLTKDNNGSVVSTVEEALDLQKQISELNRFFRNSEVPIEPNTVIEKNKQRNVRSSFMVSRNPSELEIALGVIKSFSKAKLGRQGMEFARKHLLLFEAMRKEFAEARFLATTQSQMLRAHVEIKWATSRLRLKEHESEPTAINVLSREELIPSSLQFSSDKFLAVSSLERIRGQLRYLKGLALSTKNTQQESSSLSVNPQEGFASSSTSSPTREDSMFYVKAIVNEPCPICHEILTDQKMVFLCGHVICCKCCLQLTEQVALGSVKSKQKWIMCPTCRRHTDIDSIAYADENENKMERRILQTRDLPENSILVQGSYGTKVEAVTRRILWIASKDSDAKVIVFSSWNDVLNVLEHALKTNRITYVRMKGGRKSHAAISKFKGTISNLNTPSSEVEDEPRAKETATTRVLLMLIQHGANGLNILEAQHVILVEPLLNPAAEAQAISRVHRIGQEKTTHVHRFIVKKTVEESIYKLNRSRNTVSVPSNRSKHHDHAALTLRDVQSLFPPPLTVTAEDLPGSRSLRHLPPSAAAALAAERRWSEARGGAAQLQDSNNSQESR